MDELCTACLCDGRTSVLIGQTAYYNLYQQILNEIEVYDTSAVCVRLCWECRAALRGYQRFKKQVQSCYLELLQHVRGQDVNQDSIRKEPKLQIHSASIISCPDIPIKTELKEEDAFLEIAESIKSENETEIETHHEPETFVRDLNLESHETKQKEDVKKKEIIKKTNKKKIKKKTKKKKPSVKVKKFNTPSDSEAWLDDAESEEATIGDINVDENLEKNKEPDCDTEVESGLENHVVRNKHLSRADGGGKRSRSPLPDKPQCVECGKVFSSRKTYRYHLNVLHKGQNHFPCPRCGKVYQWKSNLARHLRSHKARDTGELHCASCNKRFASVATYRQHLRLSRRHVPETEFSFSCDDCGKKFVSKTRLRDHIDWEHLKKIKFRCQLCNKAYKCHTSLYVHTQNVHLNKEKKDNLCHICGKSYQNTAKLKYHIVAMHTSETPYQCEKCSAAFGWYSSLYRHVREVHYKVKMQTKKTKKVKKLANEMMPTHLHSQNHNPPPHHV